MEDLPPPHFVIDVRYDRIERNRDLPVGLFEFHPPEGASEFVSPHPPKNAAPTQQQPLAMRVLSPPAVIAREEPEYSQEAWDEGIQGHVIVLADIDRDGTILNVRIDRSIGWGLDEKAVDCVRKWRFSPATEDGSPTRGTAYIKLTFSLPDKRPDQPSSGPITRPKPWVRLPEVELKPPTDLEEFFYVIASNFGAPALCEKIDAKADGGGGGFSERGFQVKTLQSTCFLNVATKLRDARLCDHVVPVKARGLDGSRIDKSYCVSHLDMGEVAVPFAIASFANIVQGLGYDNAQIAAFLQRRHPAFTASRAVTPEDYWEFVRDLSLRGSAQDRTEFLKRVFSLK